MSPERYYRLLGELAERLAHAETAFRRVAAKAPTTVGREDTLAVADCLSAERRRVRAIVAREEEVRRASGGWRPLLRERVEFGPLAIDPTSRRVTVAGEEVHLAGKEFALLRRLASEPTRVFTKQELLRDIWGARSLARTRTLDTHASRLRRKLNLVPDRRFVVNTWGVGYRLVEDPAEVGTD